MFATPERILQEFKQNTENQGNMQETQGSCTEGLEKPAFKEGNRLQKETTPKRKDTENPSEPFFARRNGSAILSPYFLIDLTSRQ